MRTNRRLIHTCVALLAAFFLLPATSFAQSTIAGVVKDATGAVLPGVSVEAASPVLIEKVRSVVTDGQGLYRIVDLRPGVYVVTFTLPGFSTVKREGLELPASFTATVNVELRVGGLEETLTVTGSSPQVDVQQAARKVTMNKDVIDGIPVFFRDPSAFVGMIPGVSTEASASVGGAYKTMSIHGSNPNESQQTIDGFRLDQGSSTGGNGAVYYPNIAIMDEVVASLGGSNAEQQLSGIRSNIIPKEGGNRFNSYMFGSFTSDALSSSNFSAELKALGFSESGVKTEYDLSPAVGGPIRKDKLWFFAAFRYNQNYTWIPNLYHNATPQGWKYTPDLSKPAYFQQFEGSRGGNVTWQVSPRNKINVFVDQSIHRKYNNSNGSLVSMETTPVSDSSPNILSTVVWKSPVSSRVLLDAGVGTLYSNEVNTPDTEKTGLRGSRTVFVPDTVISALESTTGMRIRARNSYDHRRTDALEYRASVSYVTGSHALKVGMGNRRGYTHNFQIINQGLNITLRDAIPTSLTLFVEPNDRKSSFHAVGLYAQDDWKKNRLTMNLGVRYDSHNGRVPAIELAAGRFVPARSFAAVKNVPDWKDVTPRLGGAYDVFGNGRTAIKATLGRYVVGEGTGLAASNSPVARSVLSANRTWTDSNGNYVPDCNLTNPAAQNLAANGGDVCGAISNVNFGLSNPAATQYDPAVLTGHRGYNWEASAALDHQVMDGLSVSVGYYRRWFGNFITTDNTRITPADHDPYCITAPRDARLPEGGGYQVCGLYNIKPALFGQSQTLTTLESKFGEQSVVFDGVDLTSDLRVRAGRINGGVSIGRTATNRCFVVDSPQELLNCDVAPPFQPNLKFSGFYPLPWDLTIGIFYKRLPGPEITASYNATNAEIAPSLGRNVSAGAAALTTVPLIKPGTMYGEAQQQLDLRLGKRITVGRARLQGSLDFQNLFNTAYARSINLQYGSRWLEPTLLQGGRLLRLSITMDY